MTAGSRQVEGSESGCESGWCAPVAAGSQDREQQGAGTGGQHWGYLGDEEVGRERGI